MPYIPVLDKNNGSSASVPKLDGANAPIPLVIGITPNVVRSFTPPSSYTKPLIRNDVDSSEASSFNATRYCEAL